MYGLEPEYRERSAGSGGSSGDSGARSDPDADARLIIGDPALKTRLNGHVVLDLAAEWRAFSGHPFVFAFWAVRGGGRTPRSRRSAPLLRGRPHALRARWSARRRESGLSEAVVEDYLRHALHFELDEGDLEGLRLFYRLAAEDGLIPEARPVDFSESGEPPTLRHRLLPA